MSNGTNLGAPVGGTHRRAFRAVDSGTYGQSDSVAFCSSATSLTFSGLIRKTHLAKSYSVLTSLGKVHQRGHRRPRPFYTELW